MNVARPQTAIAPGVDGEVLLVLAGTTQPLTGRQVARLVRRGTSPSVSAALARLAAHGLVVSQNAGSAHLHTLNRQHIAAPVVELLAGLRPELLRRLRETFTTWEPAPAHASMFGSAARGDGDTESDIDLLVVRPAGVDEDDERWDEQIDALGQAVQAWTGNHAGVVELGADELDELRRDPPAIFGDLRNDAIDLAGAPLRTLLQ